MSLPPNLPPRLALVGSGTGPTVKDHWEHVCLCSRQWGLLVGGCAYSVLFLFRISADPHYCGHHRGHPHSQPGDCTDLLSEVRSGRVPLPRAQHHQHHAWGFKYTQPSCGKRREIRQGLSNPVGRLAFLLPLIFFGLCKPYIITEENRKMCKGAQLKNHSQN